jgi:hypothetical protein
MDCLRTFCLAAKEDGVTETRGDSPQSFSAGWNGLASVSWAEPPLYSAPTSLNGSGMIPQLSSYVLLSANGHHYAVRFDLA